MSSLAEDWVPLRRQFVIRLLVEVGGEVNESVLYSGMTRGGFARDPRSALREDLDHLRDVGCLTEQWFGKLRVVTLTERGEDAAHGRIEVAGVAHSRWTR